LGCERGAVIEASGTDRIKSIFCASVYFDNADSETVRISVTDATARVSGVSFTQCSLNFSQSGDGCIVTGVSGDPGQLERVRFVGCDFLLNQLNGVYLTNCRDIDFEACHVQGNSDGTSNVNSGIFADVGIEGLRVNAGSIGAEDEFAASQRHGIVLGSGISEVRITGVDLTGNVTSPLDNGGATNLVVRDCAGFATQASGRATILNGATSVTVTHGMGLTPTNVQVSPIGDIGASGGGRVWADTIGATTFRIACTPALSADASIDWTARALGA
jgi:hypothetical protein